MKTNRRDFIKKTGALSTGLFAVSALGSASFLTGCSNSDKMKHTYKPFGIQLWTLRDVFPQNPTEVLKQLAEFGYEQIETFEGDKGIFWGMGHKGMQSFLNDHGMKLESGHCNIMENFEQKVEQAAEIGMKYLISPWIGRQETMDDYKRYADIFNERGELCKKAGLQFAYHNHEYTFEQMDGEYTQDVLMNLTDEELVKFEMDVYWVVTAGEDPLEWLKKYPNRFTLAHMKDRADVEADVLRASTVLGTGVIDFDAFYEVALENGMEYFFVEQEEYEGTTPIDAAREGAEFMKKLRA